MVKLSSNMAHLGPVSSFHRLFVSLVETQWCFLPSAAHLVGCYAIVLCICHTSATSSTSKRLSHSGATGVLLQAEIYHSDILIIVFHTEQTHNRDITLRITSYFQLRWPLVLFLIISTLPFITSSVLQCLICLGLNLGGLELISARAIGLQPTLLVIFPFHHSVNVYLGKPREIKLW